MSAGAATFRVVVPLDAEGRRQVVWESDYSFDGARLLVGDEEVACGRSREELERGLVAHPFGEGGAELRAVLEMDGSIPRVAVTLDGEPLAEEGNLRPRPSRSAWIHAFLALGASAAGFAASLLYFERADALASVHAFKMATHMAGWHFLLVVTLFPASVWGRRPGIRAVQATALLFFLIHAGIAAANLADPIPSDPTEFQIAFWNAASGIVFAVVVVYGQRAWRDMDPARALLEEGRVPQGRRAQLGATAAV